MLYHSLIDFMHELSAARVEVNGGDGGAVERASVENENEERE